MPVPNGVTKAIQELQADITTLTDSLPQWDQYAPNTGSRKYREMANRIVLQAKKLESLVKENTFSR
jgi:hypothetical protein